MILLQADGCPTGCGIPASYSSSQATALLQQLLLQLLQSRRIINKGTNSRVSVLY
uniref:Uncharacterized protein n=1 Tax=Physcomitrium patens TaxID=3218 RepID=A0A2K1IFQ0_PHYPA|nr:hypothetical protein PHYPA_028686 [Physcomitrium patens]